MEAAMLQYLESVPTPALEPESAGFIASMPSSAIARDRIDDAFPLERHAILVRWRGGVEEELDIAPILPGSRQYVRLRRDTELFRTLWADPSGSFIEWADGSIVAIARLKMLVDLKMTNVEFREATERLGIGQEGMAALLGVSRRMIGARRASTPVPISIALATRYLVSMAQSRFEHR